MKNFKKDFEEYLQNNSQYCFITDGAFSWNCTEELSNIHTSMQYGVYFNFFDSVGFYITIDRDEPGGKFDWFIVSKGINFNFEYKYETRQEAIDKAIEGAIKLYNKQL